MADLASNGRRLLHWLVQSTIHRSNLRFSPVHVFDAGESAILSPVNVVAAEEETRSNCHPKSEFMPLRSFSWKIYVLPAALD